MNPNSQHQRWSRWTIVIWLPYKQAHDDPRFLENIRCEHAHVTRQVLSPHGQARVTYAHFMGIEKWGLDARVEGVDVHDPHVRADREARLKAHYERGFGSLARVDVHAALEAGDAEDGRPPSQLIILPGLFDADLAGVQTSARPRGRAHDVRRMRIAG